MSDHVLPERPSRRRGGRARVARDTRLIAKLVRRSFRTSRDFGNTLRPVAALTPRAALHSRG